MIIDCHAHHINAPYNTNYNTWANMTGHSDYGPPYLWNNPIFEDVSKRIEVMKNNGIDYSLIIYSANVVQIIDSAVNNKVTRTDVVTDLNDKTHETVLANSGVIGATGLIDLRLGDDILAEMERISDWVLGYSVLTAYDIGGELTFLDNPKFLPFWKKAAELGKPIFIHFSNLYKINNPQYPMPGYMNESMLCAGMGQLMENTLCVSRLVLSGLFDKLPTLKVVMGQLGGLYPFMLERFAMLYTMHCNGARAMGITVTNPADTDHFIRNYKNYTDNIYVDTHSMSENAIRCAIEIIGDDKILFGSDLPITPQQWGVERGIAQLKKSLLSDSVKRKIFSENARKLIGI